MFFGERFFYGIAVKLPMWNVYSLEKYIYVYALKNSETKTTIWWTYNVVSRYFFNLKKS